MGRRRDALLTLAVIAALVALGVVVDAPVDVAALVAGGFGALLLEALLTRDAQRVRRVWDRPAVQAGSVLAAFALAGGGVLLLGPVAVTILVGGLSAYLLVLGAVSALDRIA
jgi:hypothetical protein